jgi:hypothetical protein
MVYELFIFILYVIWTLMKEAKAAEWCVKQTMCCVKHARID